MSDDKIKVEISKMTDKDWHEYLHTRINSNQKLINYLNSAGGLLRMLAKGDSEILRITEDFAKVVAKLTKEMETDRDICGLYCIEALNLDELKQFIGEALKEVDKEIEKIVVDETAKKNGVH